MVSGGDDYVELGYEWAEAGLDEFFCGVCGGWEAGFGGSEGEMKAVGCY